VVQARNDDDDDDGDDGDDDNDGEGITGFVQILESPEISSWNRAYILKNPG